MVKQLMNVMMQFELTICLPLGMFSEDQEHPLFCGSQTSKYRGTLPSARSGNDTLTCKR
jgi:hypothetical protein